ncbi:MAG: M20/M25/M40 family metallo-hydrolase, partial [Symbiobacteriaceae bacterium]|nr:M20/M25/M40 family metallo-hydrolase [Symbiobacteriaceae bacterium]
MERLPPTATLREWFSQNLEEIIQQDITIAQIPAPSWDEHDRALYLEGIFRELGLKDVEIDSVDNVIGILPGTGGGPTLLLAPHLDTVFPRNTKLEVRREGSKVYCPGIRDNSFGVTSLIWFLKALKEFQISLPGNLICVATAGEEGLGDLKGMKAAMARFHQEVDYVIAIDGGLGGLTTGGVTSRRFRIT